MIQKNTMNHQRGLENPNNGFWLFKNHMFTISAGLIQEQRQRRWLGRLLKLPLWTRTLRPLTCSSPTMRTAPRKRLLSFWSGVWQTGFQVRISSWCLNPSRWLRWHCNNNSNLKEIQQVNSCTILAYNLLQIFAFKDRRAHVAFLLEQGYYP